VYRITFGIILQIVAVPIALHAHASPHWCAAPEYRQLEFWLGDWEVRDGAGVVLGTNLVTLEFDSCVVVEHWSSKDVTGISMSMYDSATKKWYQS
jgi:hypothetical protein